MGSWINVSGETLEVMLKSKPYDSSRQIESEPIDLGFIAAVYWDQHEMGNPSKGFPIFF